MKLEEIARRIGAEYHSPDPSPREITGVYAGDSMSDLLNAAGPHTMLVTNLSNPQLYRVADIMEVPAICLVNGRLSPQLTAAAKRRTAVLLSPHSLYETCGLIYRLFGENGGQS